MFGEECCWLIDFRPFTDDLNADDVEVLRAVGGLSALAAADWTTEKAVVDMQCSLNQERYKSCAFACATNRSLGPSKI